MSTPKSKSKPKEEKKKHPSGTIVKHVSGCLAHTSSEDEITLTSVEVVEPYSQEAIDYVKERFAEADKAYLELIKLFPGYFNKGVTCRMLQLEDSILQQSEALLDIADLCTVGMTARAERPQTYIDLLAAIRSKIKYGIIRTFTLETFSYK